MNYIRRPGCAPTHHTLFLSLTELTVGAALCYEQNSRYVFHGRSKPSLTRLLVWYGTFTLSKHRMGLAHTRLGPADTKTNSDTLRRLGAVTLRTPPPSLSRRGWIRR